MNADSVKARLKNFAIKSGCTFQEAITYYGLERAIYRISISEYAEHFILKGGIFLYAIFDRNYERATTDVDFLARRISNSREEMMDFPVILDMEPPRVNAYSLETSIAEKLEAIIHKTFEHRNTQMTMDSAAFSDEFLNDPMHQTRWKAFLKKKKALIQVSLPDVMDWIKAFVRPLLDGTKKARWNPEKGIWE